MTITIAAVLLALTVGDDPLLVSQPPTDPRPQASESAKVDPRQVLKHWGIQVDAEGIAALIHDLEKGRFAPLSAERVEALIGQLGSESFRLREQAAKALQMSFRPPLEQIKKATEHCDLEIAQRARLLVTALENRPDPLQAVFQILKEQPRTPTASLVKLLAFCDTHAALNEAHETLIPRLGPADAPLIRDWLKDADPAMRATGIRALEIVVREKKEFVLELQKHMKDPSPLVRSTAARTLIRRGEKIDPKEFASLLDLDSLILLYRTAEIEFRKTHREKRKDPQVSGEFQTLAEQYASALMKSKEVKHEKLPPANNIHWIQLGLDTSKHPEVVLYRVKWFGGQWSAWFLPGFNDRLDDPRNIRAWACFNDHEYEVISTTRKDWHRHVDDVP